MTTKIRTAIVGLSSSAATSWASQAHLPYLLSEQGRKRYEIVALLNSSVEAAKEAVKFYNLPASTKTYGDPAALAADPDVDYVVVNTRVDKHYEPALPSVKAGKAVYVEWPLAQDVKHARELVEAAREAGTLQQKKAIIGLQGRFAPPVQKVKALIGEGRIGKVLSSDFRMNGGTNSRNAVPPKLSYFTSKAIGGNPITIIFGHFIDQVQHVLGELEDVKSHAQIQRPRANIVDPETKTVVETVQSDTPDLISLTARLSGGANVVEDATISGRFRRGQSFPGEPWLLWSIHGEKGEIRVTCQDGSTMNVGWNPTVVEVVDFAADGGPDGEIQKLDTPWPEWSKDLNISAKNIGEVYEAFAEGRTENLVTFDVALRRHELIEGIINSTK